MQAIPTPIRGALVAGVLLILTTIAPTDVRAQGYNVLKECAALSSVLDDIHTCLDNYLDIMDENLSRMDNYLGTTLEGESLSGYQLSQQAFVEYRRQNCLWYLDFSAPRIEAEQIAKNCLATMSQQRYRELQALVSGENLSGPTVSGYYVYGPGRNSFQLCGSEDRFWLDGDASEVSNAQQLYLSLATGDFQVMFAQFAGTVSIGDAAPAEHQGVFNISRLVDMSVPKESDCRLPGNLANGAGALGSNTQSANALDDDNEQASPDSAEPDEPEQQLTAYFGAWLADCTENNGKRQCELQVALEDEASDGVNSSLVSDAVVPAFIVVREKRQSTRLELLFPEQEIDTPSRIHWRIDDATLGDIVGSEIRVDEFASRLLVPEGEYLNKELLPVLMKGAELFVEVLESVDDETGRRYVATLNGLSRATAFADDFVRDAL